MTHNKYCELPQADFVIRQLESVPNIGWLKTVTTDGMISLSPTLARIVTGTASTRTIPAAQFIEAIHPDNRRQVAELLTEQPVKIATEEGGRQVKNKAKKSDHEQTPPTHESTGTDESGSVSNATDASGGTKFEVDFQILVADNASESVISPVSAHGDNTQTNDREHNKSTVDTTPEDVTKKEAATGEKKETNDETSGTKYISMRMRGEAAPLQDTTGGGANASNEQTGKETTQQQETGREVGFQAIIEILDRQPSGSAQQTNSNKAAGEESKANAVDRTRATDSTNQVSVSNSDQTPASATDGNRGAELSDDSDQDSQIPQEAHDLFVDGPVAVMQWEPESGWPIRDASENIDSLLGYARSEVQGEKRDYEPFVHPDDRARVEDCVKNKTEEGVSYFKHQPYRIITAAGEIRWVLDFTQVLRDADGAVTSYVGYLVDITDHKRNESYLKQAEVIGEIGSWRLDARNNQVWWSDGLCEIFGVTPENSPETLDEAVAYFNLQDREEIHSTYQEPIDQLSSDRRYQIQTEDGEKWVKISAEQEYGSDESVTSVLGVVKDITEIVKQEQDLQIINNKLKELIELESPTGEEIYTILVTAIDDLVEAKSVIAFDRTDTGHLAPAKCNDDETIPIIEPGGGPLWDAFASSQETYLPAETVPATELPTDNISGSILALSVGNHGMIVAILPTERKIRDSTVELAKTIIAAGSETYKRSISLIKIEEQNQKLEKYSGKLKQAQSLNELLRSLQQQLVNATSKEEIFASTCSVLDHYDKFDGVSIYKKEIDSDNIILIKSSEGVQGYLDRIELCTETNSSLPAVRALKRQSTIGPVATSEYISEDSWSKEALKEGYQSVISIPITYDQLIYGTVSVYSETSTVFSEEIISIMSDLCSLVGSHINRVEMQRSLGGSTRQNVEYEIEIKNESEDPIVELADSISGAIHIHNIVSQKKHTNLAHCEISDTDADSLSSAINNIEGIYELNQITDSMYEIVITSQSIISKIAPINGKLESLRVTPTRSSLIMSFEKEINLNQTTKQIDQQFESASLKAKSEQPLRDPTSISIALPKSLSNQQEKILRTAYYDGYFDVNRKRTGGEIAESLGITQPTFSKHLRGAQRNLFAAIWGNDRV